MIIWKAVRDLQPHYGLTNKEVQSLRDAIARELHAPNRKYFKGKNSRLLRVLGALNNKRRAKRLSLLDRNRLATEATGILNDAILEQSLRSQPPATNACVTSPKDAEF